MMEHPRFLSWRRLGLGAALALAPHVAVAQGLERLLNTPAAPPVASAPVTATAPAAPTATAPAPTPAVAADPDLSWSWLLARDSRASTLLAIGARSVTVISWDQNGVIGFVGTSQDADGKAGAELARRLREGPAPMDSLDAEAVLDAPVWVAWQQKGKDEGGADRTEGRTQALPVSTTPLKAAITGERRGAQRLRLNGVGALLVAFPYPGSPTSFDAQHDGTALAELMPALSLMTDGTMPTPMAGLKGVKASTVQSLGEDAMGLYKAADGHAWAFWILAP